MAKKDVVIIKSSLMSEGIRRSKWNKLLKEEYNITALSWDRGKRCNINLKNGLCSEIKFTFKAPWGVKILPYLPIWWCFVFFKLIITKWDIAHVINFDSIIPAIFASKIKRKPVIYEILETYEDQTILPAKLRDILIRLDKKCMKYSNAIILADESQIEEFGEIPNSKILCVYDCPDSKPLSPTQDRQNEVFTLFFAGVLDSERLLNLDQLFLAIQNIENVKVVIAGFGNLVEHIKSKALDNPTRIEFIGEINHNEVIEWSNKADLLFVLRSPIRPVNKYICGSKFLEAMMCGKPILVNEGTSTAKKVREENCGLVVNAENIEEIKKAIITLRDNPELCREFGINSINAYHSKYNWEIMTIQILNLYHELI